MISQSHCNHMDASERESLVEQIIGACYEVSNTLGAGFLEKVYHRALSCELTSRGLHATDEARFAVHYKGLCVGEYSADLVVENTVIVEIKCADQFTNAHIAQCLNYLRATGLHLALLVNFQKPRVEWRRIVLGI